LLKAFLAELTGVPTPYSARGNAIDFGNTLVSQGYAQPVTDCSQLTPGDILVYDEGTLYGHIALYIGDNQLFEENCALPPATKTPNGTWTSRIGDYRPATYIYRLLKQYFTDNEQEDNNMRQVDNKGDGALHWFTDTHFGGYHDYDELVADLNNGQAVLPVIDWSDRSAPWDVRIESTRIRI
jgi:hypothetical protein